MGQIRTKRTIEVGMGTKGSWTPERKAKQAEAIRRWKPWEHSTGPKSDAGKRVASQNARLPPLSPELENLWERLVAGRVLWKGIHGREASPRLSERLKRRC